VEKNELELFKFNLYCSSGDYAKALAHLDEKKADICDTLVWRECKGNP